MSDDPKESWRALEKIEFFAGLDADCLASIHQLLVPLRVPTGTALITQGDWGDGLFVVLHGRFVVEFLGEDEILRRVGEIAAGEVVGEMALLSEEARATTVRALRDSEVLKLSAQDFDSLTLEYPILCRRLAISLADRLRTANRSCNPIAARRTVALLAHRSDSAVVDFAKELANALQTCANPLTVSRASVAHLWSSTRDDPAELLAWLAQREREDRCVLLVAEAEQLAWNRFCAAQADVILVVAQASDPPEAATLESALWPALMASRELVLLHAPETTPEGTRRWLEPGRFERHHHMRVGDRKHYERLARWLSGQAIGLVFGGGGARGFAHIGVVRALAEEGVPVDMVAGTSMGSIMGAQLALGWDWQTMQERSGRAFSCEPLKRDHTLPLLSLITSGRVVRMFQELFGEKRIEDCWLPYFCMAANLTHARPMVLREGPIWQRVRASSALPGIGPPVIENGEYIVDGAILNNLPAELMRSEGAGRVIAVNVSPREDLRSEWPDTYQLSGWRALWAQLGFGGLPPLPAMLWVVQRTVLLSSVADANGMEKRVSLYLRPPVEEFEMFNWSRIDEVVEAGFTYAIAPIAEWVAKGPSFPSSRMLDSVNDNSGPLDARSVSAASQT